MEINASNTENIKSLPEDQKATGISRKREKAAIAKKISAATPIPLKVLDEASFVPEESIKRSAARLQLSADPEPKKKIVRKSKKNVPKVKKVVAKVAKAVINRAKVVAKAVKKDKRHGKKNRGKNRKG